MLSMAERRTYNPLIQVQALMTAPSAVKGQLLPPAHASPFPGMALSCRLWKGCIRDSGKKVPFYGRGGGWNLIKHREGKKSKKGRERMIQKELIRIKVEDLVPYERNPRKIPQEAVDDVRESYKQCGVIDPIEIDEENVILSGHTRRLAAIEEGIKEVDALRVTGLTEPQKRKYRLLANKTGEKSGWDYEILDWELEDLDFEGYDFGFDISGGDIDFDDMFSDAGNHEKKKKTVVCPHCGEEFELE